MSDISGEALLYAALTIVAVGLFAYLAYLQYRQRRLEKEAARLEEMVRSGRKPG